MDYERFFPTAVQMAVRYEPPGAWMPQTPPGCIRLSAGFPAPDLIPFRELAQAMQQVTEKEQDRPFQYLGSPAMAALPDLIRARCATRGMVVAPEEILVTLGACQVLDLAARALLDQESMIAVEAPTYMEALEVFRNYTPTIVGYPVDASGLQVDALDADLRSRRARNQALPRLLYTISSHQNPTGATLSLDRRLRLLALAEEYDFLILEDDAYGELAFTPGPPPLRSLDRGGRVIYAGSLSKVLAPGLRVGWAAAAPRLLQAMNTFKKDLEHAVGQSLVAQYLAAHDLTARIDFLRGAYRVRRDVLLRALRDYMPPSAAWSEPCGGYFVWVHTPGTHTAHLLPRALAAGVSYIPGNRFFFGGEAGSEYLRLSFSHVQPAEMSRGVQILAGLLKT